MGWSFKIQAAILSVFEQYLPKTTPPTEVQTTEMTQRESAPPLRMAEVNEMSEISPDGHDEMPFRLGDIVLEKKFADLHPCLLYTSDAADEL